MEEEVNISNKGKFIKQRNVKPLYIHVFIIVNCQMNSVKNHFLFQITLERLKSNICSGCVRSES